MDLLLASLSAALLGCRFIDEGSRSWCWPDPISRDEAAESQEMLPSALSEREPSLAKLRIPESSRVDIIESEGDARLAS